MNIQIQKFLLASIAVVCLVSGALIGFLPVPAASEEFLRGLLMKLGVVLGMAWLAAPQLAKLGWARLQGSLLVGVIVVLILWAIRPRIGAIAGAGFAIGCLFFGIIGWLRNATKP
ncbi:MAG: hypothetical protein KDB22_19740 [Planctomycetales bacterium]|nr:hypothetical protein [Planctomycetales bacterium]